MKRPIALLGALVLCLLSVESGRTQQGTNWLPLGGPRLFYNKANGNWFTWVSVNQARTGLCGSPQYYIRITKNNDATYWGPGGPGSVDYYLTVDPDGTYHSPFQIIYSDNGATQPQLVAFTEPPSNQLFPWPANQYQGYSFSAHVVYKFDMYSGLPTSSSCDYSGSANTKWTTKIPLLTQNTMEGSYEEYGDGQPECNDFTEQWFFLASFGIEEIDYQHGTCLSGGILATPFLPVKK